MNANNEHEVDRMIAERFSAFSGQGDWQPNMHRGLAMLRQRRTLARGRRMQWGMCAAASAAVCLPLLAFPMTRAFAGRCVSACVQETNVMREFLLGRVVPVAADGFAKPDDRRPAPDFLLTDAAGNQVKLSDFRGKVVLLNFWATWCRPCSDEIPWFTEMQQSYSERGFSVIGVSMDYDGWSAVMPFIKSKGVNYPVVIGNDNVAREFGGLKSIPLSIVIDRSGRVAALHAGICRRDEYENDINRVLNER
jgi:peroxiredoxin